MSDHIPTELTGHCYLSIVHGGDIYGHAAFVEWRDDEVAIKRYVSGTREFTETTERDTLTEDALLGLIVAGAHAQRPEPDFQMVIVGTDMRDGRRAMIEIIAIEGEITVARCHTDTRPLALPAWFLRLLYDLVLDDPNQ